MTNPPSFIRGATWPRGKNRPLGTPLQPSVAYVSKSPDMLDEVYRGHESGYTYTREGHPNADVLARRIDDMEGVRSGFITGSGMSAITAAILGILDKGDHLLAGDRLYGRSRRMLSEDLPRFGIGCTFVDSTDADMFEAAVTPATKAMLVEIVSNPTLRVADMEGIHRVAEKHGLCLIVDNTFTTPRAYRPFAHGADVVVHSITKLLSGHSDATLGYAVSNDSALNERLRALCVTWGLTGSPFDCWLAERGLYSFEIRYDRAESNARLLADSLAELPGIRRVLYPLHPDHPDRARARSLLGERGGNMVGFEIEGGREHANRLVRAARNISFAPTLGDIGTILSHPASSSHRELSEKDRHALGIAEGFFRVSTGVEEPDLLIGEFAAAVRAATDVR